MTKTIKYNKKGGFANPVAQKLASVQEQAGKHFSGLQEQAGKNISGLQEQAGKQFSGLKGQVKSFIPEMSVNGVLKKAFGLNDEQLAALGKADPSILQRAFWESLNGKKWALVTSALGFIPFIGQDFLAAISVYKEATEVLSDSTKKIQALLPKTSVSESGGIEMQDLSASATTAVTAGGARARNSNSILRRIEKSKKVFHNTNKSNATFGKSKKPSKTRKQKRMRRMSK